MRGCRLKGVSTLGYQYLTSGGRIKCLSWYGKAQANGLDICFTQINVSSSCVCPVIDHESVRHNIVKVAEDPRGDSRVDPQTTLTII